MAAGVKGVLLDPQGSTPIPSGRTGLYASSAEAPIFVKADGSTVTLAAGGTIDGSGSAGKIVKWSDADTIADSVVTESSSNIGINCTPLAALDVTTTGGADGTISLGSNMAQAYGYYTNSTTLGGGLRINNYYSSGDKHTRTGRAALLTWNAGVWQFQRVASGSADAAITWLEDFAIDTSGVITIRGPLQSQASANLDLRRQTFLDADWGMHFYNGSTIIYMRLGYASGTHWLRFGSGAAPKPGLLVSDERIALSNNGATGGCEFVPQTNNTGSVGVSGLAWGSVFTIALNFNGQTVSKGAAESGGAGFSCLRVPN